MIGNEKKLDLIKFRKETLEQMKFLAWKLAGVPESQTELRDEYVKTIRVFGQVARDTKEKIANLP